MLEIDICVFSLPHPQAHDQVCLHCVAAKQRFSLSQDKKDDGYVLKKQPKKNEDNRENIKDSKTNKQNDGIC